MINSRKRVFVSFGLLCLWMVCTSFLRAQEDSAEDTLQKSLQGMGSSQKAESLLTLAREFWNSDPEKSISLAEEALVIAIDLDDPENAADAYNIIGGAYYNLQQPFPALENLKMALEISRQDGYDEGHGKAANNLGLVYDYLGEYDLAIQHYFEALELDRKHNNQEGIAIEYLNIGNIYYYLEDYDRAIEYMTNSLSIYKALGNESGVLSCYTNIGSTYTKIAIPESALDYLNKALELSTRLGDKDLQSANLNNIGEVHAMQGNYFKALEFFNKALVLERQIQDRWSEANTLKNMANAYIRINIQNEAKLHFERALDLAKKINAHTLILEILQDLARFYESKGDPSAALKYYKQYTGIRDSLFRWDSRKQIADIETKFKIRNQTREMELLKRENELKELKIIKQNYLLIFGVFTILIILAIVIILQFRSRITLKEKMFQQEKSLEIANQKRILERTVAKLTESQQKYESLIASVQDALVIVQDKRIVYANQQLCRLIGYDSMDEIRKLTFADVISEQDLRMVSDNFDRRTAGGEVPENYSFRVLHRSGAHKLVNMSVKLITFRNRPAVIATLKDITTEQDYENRLIHEKEKAIQETQSKSMFLAGASHEIRNHLHSINGLTEILEDTPLSKEQQEYVQIIKVSGNNLLTIINDILDFSKIEAGQISLEKTRFHIKDVIHDVKSISLLEAKNKGLDLTAAIGDDVPGTLIGDPVRLNQIILNLVSNAVKFTDQGSIHIQVEPEFGKPATGSTVRLLFRVSDTGIGIAREHHELLFKPFAQPRSGSLRKTGGSGLGLAICRQLVELMNGEIGLESEPGKGSTFWFTAEFESNGSVSAGRHPTKKRSRDAEINNILLVEDNKLNQQLTTAILHKEGYQTDVAENGRDGLDLFRKKRYEVVLMDLQMPVMDGFEASRLIRAFEAEHHRKKSAIIAVTAHAREQERSTMVEAGIDAYIQKPFSPADLLRIIENTVHSGPA